MYSIRSGSCGSVFMGRVAIAPAQLSLCGVLDAIDAPAPWVTFATLRHCSDYFSAAAGRAEELCSTRL